MTQSTPAADAYRAAQTDPAKLIERLQAAESTLSDLFSWTRSFASHEATLGDVDADLAAGRVPTWAPWDEETEPDAPPKPSIADMVPFNGAEHREEALRLQASGRRFEHRIDVKCPWFHENPLRFASGSDQALYRMLPLEPVAA